MNDVMVDQKQLVLMNKIQYFRLTNDLAIIDLKINELSAGIDENAGSFRKFFFELGESGRQNRKNELLGQKQIILKKIDDFTKQYPNINFNLLKEEQIIHEINLYFPEDKSLRKSIFAICIVLDNAVEYTFPDQSLEMVSQWLYHNPTALLSMRNEVKQIYCDINKKPFTATQRGLMIGVGAISAALLFIVPTILVGGIGASAATTTSALAFAGDMQLGVGLFSLFSALLGGIALNVTYGALSSANRHEILSNFRKMKPDEIASFLSIRCLLLANAREYSSTSDFKGLVSDLLSVVSDVKSDTDSCLFVERENAEENKEKLRIFHNFDQKMIKILAL